MSWTEAVGGVADPRLIGLPAVRLVPRGTVLMSGASALQLAVVLAAVLVCVKPLGLYIASVMDGRPPAATRLVARLERRIYLAAGIEPAREMDWQGYALALLMFNGLGTLAVYAFQRLQHLLPLNPQGLGPVSPQSAFNTAISFVTNTNWQGYAGETTMSYLTQMAALTVQNFLSAASGIVVAVALVRGFCRHSSKTIGNCWVDLTRATLYLLLPLAVALALILAAQGVVQTLGPNRTVTTLEPTTYLEQPAAGSATAPAAPAPARQVVVQQQTLPMGPVASQESIKQLGTNGGGFMNANSAHPFENPSALTNLLSIAGDAPDPYGAYLHVRAPGRGHAPGVGAAEPRFPYSSSRWYCFPRMRSKAATRS